MNITVVTGAFLPTPPGPAGAVEKIWWRLAQEFARQGHAVTVVSRNYSGLSPREDRSGVRHIRTSGFDRSGYLTIDLICDFLYTLAVLTVLPKSQILVTNTFFLPILASLGRHRFGKIVVSVKRF